MEGRRVWQGCVGALATVALAAGCGGGDGGGNSGRDGERGATKTSPTVPRRTTAAIPGAPKAKETTAETLARLRTAARKRDCSNPRELFLFAEIRGKLCKRLLPQLEPVASHALRKYGSGAVMRNATGGQTILALDRSGRFKYGAAFDRVPGSLPPDEAEEVMNSAVDALRRGSCRDLVSISLTYAQGGQGADFCALAPVRRLRGALRRDPQAQPRLLGGNGAFAFAGVATGGGYFTLLFAADETGYLFVTSLAA